MSDKPSPPVRVRRPISRLIRHGSGPDVRRWPGGHEYQGGTTRPVKSAAALLLRLLERRGPG